MYQTEICYSDQWSNGQLKEDDRGYSEKRYTGRINTSVAALERIGSSAD